jgi:molybdopterin converting factor small subunit
MTSDERVREEPTTDERVREEPTTDERLQVTVRYFGAARGAAGVETETVTSDADTSLAELAQQLAERNGRLAAVLARCSYLCDGVAVRDTAARVQTGQTIDVLPPFAGG